MSSSYQIFSKSKGILVFWLFLFFGHFATSATPIVLFEQEVKPIGKRISLLADQENKLDIHRILANDEVQFNPSDQAIPYLGVMSGTHWVKVKVENPHPNANFLIEVAFPTLEEIIFYEVDGDKVVDSLVLGENHPYYNRKYNHQHYIYPINVAQNEQKTFYIKISHHRPAYLPIQIGRPEEISQNLLKKDLIFGLYGGVIIVMLLYNLFIFFSTRDKSYLWYVIYILAVGLTQANFQGYDLRFFWPNSQWLNIHAVYLLSALVGTTAVFFMRDFLKTKQKVPQYDRFFKYFIGIYALSVLAMFIGFYKTSFTIVEINAFMTANFMVFVAYTIARKGDRTAWFFLVAWIIFLIGVSFFVLKDFNILPYNNFTVYLMPFGSALEVILLSLALADRINTLKKEKEKSNQRAIRVLRDKQEIIKNQNVILETKVKERTKQLEDLNEELQKALDELKNTQAQLVSAEKMASLGQLTAGIAHEINNPINFVSSNIAPLKRDFADLLELMSKYEVLNETGENIQKQIAAIQDFKEEIDFDYLMEEINMLLDGIEEGAKRTAEIIRGLKTFSRLDEAELQLTNINDGLSSTLLLLNNMVRDRIELETSLGQIPKTACYAGKLNQVFMNIVSNAIQAVEERIEKEPEHKGKIQITTSLTPEGNIAIRIQDNGIGMTPETKAKIFEPFFTTKSVGAGTGLGMAIVYNVLKFHQATIKIDSTYGKGTEFLIELPVRKSGF